MRPLPLAHSLLTVLALVPRAAPGAPAAGPGLRVAEVASGFEAPTFASSPPGDRRIFVLEQPGRIRIVRGGRVLSRPFLDLRSLVRSGGERGLLGLAFHPDYGHAGTFYVDYTDRNGDTRVARYHVSADPDVADPASATQVLFVKQPYSNHNGGMLAFGPDGMLYVALGDGGSERDPHANGQDLATLLAKLLRLDVDHGAPYTIPRDNPFAHRAGARGEIWAYGLRNPWRFSFDRAAPVLYIADVGQDKWEEVDVANAHAAGINYGWSVREGMHPFRPDRPVTGRTPTDPVIEYSHSDGCSITGGYVYRGAAMPWLRGTYFYSDWCGGWLRSFRWQGGRATQARQWPVGFVGKVTSFGEDGAGELLITTSEGRLLRLAPAR